MVALKELRQGKFDIERDDQIEMKVLRELNNDHVVSTAGDPRKADFQLLLFFLSFLLLLAKCAHQVGYIFHSESTVCSNIM